MRISCTYIPNPVIKCKACRTGLTLNNNCWVIELSSDYENYLARNEYESKEFTLIGAECMWVISTKLSECTPPPKARGENNMRNTDGSAGNGRFACSEVH